MRHVIRIVGRILAALALSAAITFVLFRLIHVNAATTGFFYLVAILFIATRGGLVESTISSIVAMACFNYFFLLGSAYGFFARHMAIRYR
jgi:K+-sensing histidine kinase KdpD